MTIVISIATIVKSMAPPKNISHFTQSGAFGWGGAEGGDDDEPEGDDDDNSGGDDSVVKALTALQAL